MSNQIHDPNELIAVVDKNNNVIGNATRKDVHAQGLLHREVGVFIRNDDDEILLQTRIDTKRLDPSAGGHFPYFQTYQEAATRELEEELGIKVYPKMLKEIFIELITSKTKKGLVHDKYVGIFELRQAIPIKEIKFNKDEVADVKYFSILELEKMLKDDVTQFEEDTAQSLVIYLKLIKLSNLES